MLENLFKSLGIAKRAEEQNIDIAMELDKAIADGEIDMNRFIAKEEDDDASQNKLKIYRSKSNLYYFSSNLLRSTLRGLKQRNDLFPYGDPQRDFVLNDFAKQEPILAGAVYSMCTKMSSLSWTVLGRKNLAIYFSDIIENALTLNGQGWGDFISSTAQDFHTLDRGPFWHTPRQGSNLTGRLSQLVYMDALACGMTGNMDKPVFYCSPVTGQDLYFKPGEFAHFASMVSPREDHFGIGFSSVARAYRSARILYGLTDYDWEKLNNLPPEGVAAVSGLTQDEFNDSLEIWRAARESNRTFTYPQVLWLMASQPGTDVKVSFTGFSEIPESFDRKSVVDQYVNVLALVFGVDAREFWPVSTSSMGTAAESEIQHMKARGKGHAELLTIVTRYFNREMPDGVEFSFDTQDVAEDQISAAVAKGWIDAFMPLYTPGKGSTPTKTPNAPTVTLPEGGASQSRAQPTEGANDAEPLITKDQFLRLLINRRVLPEWLMGNQDRAIYTDTGIEEKQDWLEGDGDSPVKLVYKDGKLKLYRQIPYEITPISSNLPKTSVTERNQNLGVNLPYATKNLTTDVLEASEDVSATQSDPVFRELPKPNIKGHPIPDHESLRGPRVTDKILQQELELWQNTPELQAYAPTLDEKDLIDSLLEVV